jgi:hypothetical protein
MPAYSRGDASLESYLVKIIAALCRNAGGEIRIRGDLIDVIDQPVTLMKSWDSRTQELVLSTSTGTFTEVFRAVPEKHPVKEVIAADPLRKQDDLPLFNKSASTLDDEKLANLEKKVDKIRIARKLQQELDARRQPEA